MIPILHKLDLTDLSVDTFSTSEREPSFLYAAPQPGGLGEPLTDCFSTCGFMGSVTE